MRAFLRSETGSGAMVAMFIGFVAASVAITFEQDPDVLYVAPLSLVIVYIAGAAAMIFCLEAHVLDPEDV